MINYYKLIITSLAKSVGRPKKQKTDKQVSLVSGYTCFDERVETFKTEKEALDYLKENYQKHKKEKMFIDDKEGNAKQVGWIYSFKNKDWSHNSEWWFQQDWVELRKVAEETMIINL